MMRTSGKNPCTCTYLKAGLRYPKGRSHGKHGHGLWLDTLYFLCNQSETVSKVDNCCLDATSYL